MLLGFIVSSCGSDFLEEEPNLTQANEIVLSNFDGLNQATAGTYTYLDHESWYGSAYNIIADLRADNAKSSPISSGRYQLDYNWNYNSANTAGYWSIGFYTIAKANNVLNAINETYDISIEPTVTQDMLDHLKAEALFMRSLAYFDLVRLYGQPYTFAPESLGVPLVYVTEIGEPARNTVGEVYQQIVKDLTDAIDMFDSEFYSNYRAVIDPKAVATADATRALLARVYLYMGDYTNAAAYASQIIAKTSDYSMYTVGNYTTVWGTDGASEVIFEVYGSTGNANNPYWENIGNMYDPDGYGDVCATNNLLALFEAGDVRANLFKTKAGYEAFRWPSKYPGKANLREDNIPILRLSEMYLIRAEASLNGVVTSGVTALDDYNMIRTNRGLASATSVNMNDLFDERRRELCFEGHLVFDYARLNKSLDRVDEDNKISGTEDISFPSYRWALPIPISEMEANENMVQNPEY